MTERPLRLTTCTSWSALIYVLTVLIQQVHAQDASSQIQIRASIGFAETFRLGYWAPLHVSISNEGSNIVGELNVQLLYGDELNDSLRPKLHRRRLDLSKGSRKRFRFTVYLESFAHPVVIKVSSGGREIARQSIDLRRRFTEGRLIVVLSRDANLDYLNDGTGDSLRVLYPHPELLPDHWLGYDGVTAVIVQGISLEELSTRQFEALKKWIAHGGKLAVSGGSDYSLLRTPRLAELLPANPTGLIKISESTRLGEALGGQLQAQAPFHILRSSKLRGRVLHEVDALALVVQENNGRGQVTYLSFDVGNPPFDQWPAMKRLWFTMLGMAPTLRQSFQKREIRRLSPIPSIINRGSGGFPNHQVVLIFAVLYLGVLATAYQLRPAHKHAQRVLSAIIVGCPLLFAPVAYFIFGPLLYPVGSTAVIVSVIRPFGSGPYAALDIDLGLYSNQQRQFHLKLESTEPGFVTNHREERWGKARGFTQHEAAGLSIEPAGIDAYVLHLLQGEDVIAYDVRASALASPTDIALSVRNDTGQSWRNTWLVFEQNLYELGPLPHNDGADVVRRGSALLGKLTTESWRSVRLDSERSNPIESHMTQLLLKRAFDEYLGLTSFGADKALLLATTQSPVRIAQHSSAWQHEELALVQMEIDVGTNMRTNDPH